MMTQTHDEAPNPGPEPGPDDGPRVNRDQLHDLEQLRRSRTDRYVAGVAGGLGRHFGIDPTVIRVVLAALCLFGGAGLLLYGAVWLFVPEEGRDRAPIHVSGEARRVLLIAAAAVAALALLGDTWGGFGWHFGWLCGVVAVILAVVLGGSRHREERRNATYVVRNQPAAPGTATADPTSYAGPTAGEATPPPPGWQAPAPIYRPRRPARTGLLLFWPSLALIALGLGILGIYDIDNHVAAGAWAAVALGVIGAMLVIGAFVGRPGGLILLGALAVPALAVSSAVGDFGHWENHTVRYTPTSATAVNDDYRITNGRLVLDLSDVDDPAALAGRSVAVHLNAGEVKVVLPRGVRTAVSASLGFAGDVEVGNRDQSGFGPQIHQILYPPGATVTGPELELDVHGHVGHIEIDRK